ncbi:putative membrane-associated protein [Leptomonas seymouri]|uniref:Putative membrane-associated protein n=1 Tax=Leptomonas seymouri TaxID=5684 RepID=A0A0N0P5L7_LEPSE|nr:putative membrane-associated protein [Leptomonas seymouri]|eukprot:KPI86616.1 putative membrane-associated protein [Leptomonas seymouri]
MLERVILFNVHCVLDLFFYRIPRWIRALLVKLPVTLWQLITGRRPLTYVPSTERHIAVITSQSNPAAGEKVMRLFGLSKSMTYNGPLYSGHIHTVIGCARTSHRVAYERELLKAEDTNPICLDWLRVPAGSDAKGIILLIPGLGNYGQSNYIQRFARFAVQHGYHVCLLTPRGMGSAPLTTPNITCVTFTSDIRHILRHRLQRDMIMAEFGAALPLFAVGYSCGSSTLVKCVAEETQAHKASNNTLYKTGFPIEAVLSMIAPNDMHASTEVLQTRIGTLLYAKPIFSALCKYLRKHSKTLQSASEGKTEEEKQQLALLHTDFEAAMKLIQDLKDIDVHVVAPHFGYADRFAYYKDGNLLQYVEKIHNVPVLCFNTRDDPIVGYAVSHAAWQATCDLNCNAVYVEVPSGGHFGFVQTPLQEWSRPFSYLQTFPLTALDSVVTSLQRKKQQQEPSGV